MQSALTTNLVMAHLLTKTQSGVRAAVKPGPRMSSRVAVLLTSTAALKNRRDCGASSYPEKVYHDFEASKSVPFHQKRNNGREGRRGGLNPRTVCLHDSVR